MSEMRCNHDGCGMFADHAGYCSKHQPEFELTVQQEADLAQSANDWINLLIVEKLVDPFKHAEIAAVIARAMRNSVIAQVKEIIPLRETLKEAGIRLGEITVHALKLEKHGVTLATHLSAANEIGDVAAKALDLMSRQTCQCLQEIDEGGVTTIQHTEGCTAKISKDALDAMKKLMEPLIEGA